LKIDDSYEAQSPHKGRGRKAHPGVEHKKYGPRHCTSDKSFAGPRIWPPQILNSHKEQCDQRSKTE
jgi:hypothetical protein